ncbi:MAG: peptide deformylase [Ignavibacteriaceae bacterium]
MAILPITMFGDKILRKKVNKVKAVDNEISELITNMFDTMRNASGIGLAANQVGANRSIFIVDLSNVEEYEEFKPLVFINPKIVKYSKEQTVFEEGCLSIPEIRSDVERPEAITIKYQDAEFKEQTMDADNLLARVIQHEYDHLFGILFTDLVNDEMKKRLKKSLHRIRKRKIDIAYPISKTIDYQLTL